MNIRLFVAIFLASSIVGLAQQSTIQGCRGGYHPRSALFYGISVWNQIQPTERGDHLVLLQLEDGYYQKIAVKDKGDKIEVWRFAPTENIFKTLQDLEDHCLLPGDPAQAVGLVNPQWQRAEISRSQFEKIHRGFIGGLTLYVDDIRSKYASILSNGGTLRFHNREVVATYDNDGDEHLVLTINFGAGADGNPLALSTWADETIKLAESLFAKATPVTSGLR